MAERKAISRDMQCLEDFGYDIVKCENHNDGWYMIGQAFEDYELKMLVDGRGVGSIFDVDRQS